MANRANTMPSASDTMASLGYSLSNASAESVAITPQNSFFVGLMIATPLAGAFWTAAYALVRWLL